MDWVWKQNFPKNQLILWLIIKTLKTALGEMASVVGNRHAVDNLLLKTFKNLKTQLKKPYNWGIGKMLL